MASHSQPEVVGGDPGCRWPSDRGERGRREKERI